MKKVMYALLVCAISPAAFAIVVSQFVDTDSAIERAKDIVVAECVSIPTNTTGLRDGLYKVEVNVIRALKGDKQRGEQIIATIYPMTPGKKYLLSSLGGSVGEAGGVAATDFLAVPQLSVVEIPSNFDLRALDGKELKEQMQSIFSGHLFQVERQIAPLLQEKGLLERAVADSRSVWFESAAPMRIGRIAEVVSTNEHWLVWLDLEGKKLEWSGSMPGKDGYLYFEKVKPPRSPYWEFSLSSVSKIEDLANKPLKAKFFGYYMPGSDGSSIRVSVGQVLLARTIDERSKIFVIQIVAQNQDQERVSARYAIVQR